MKIANSIISIAVMGLLAACGRPVDKVHFQKESSAEVVQKKETLQSTPASVEDSLSLGNYIAQCTAVLGKIPQINCDPQSPSEGTKVKRIPVFLEGALFAFGSKLSPGDQQLLEERKSTAKYPCDFPSIGGDFPCTVGSTLVQYQSSDNPNVQWVGLCRGIKRDNPNYDRFIGNGLIGANVKTGEMCFFFGLNPDPEKPYELPALTNSNLSDESYLPWQPPAKMPGSCISCHPNNDPWIQTPWLMPNYMSAILKDPKYPLKIPAGIAIDDVMAASIIESTPTKLQTMLPAPLPAGRTAWTEEEILSPSQEVKIRQYRIVGSGYVDAEAKGLMQPRTGIRPETWAINFRDRIRVAPLASTCAGACHVLGNEWHDKMSADAHGEKYALAYLTDFMKAAPVSVGHWMPELQTDPEINDTPAYTEPVISECPIPKSLTEQPEIVINCNGLEAEISWTYAQTFGGVADRDDVRFDLAYTENQGELGGVSLQNSIEGKEIVGTQSLTVLKNYAPADRTQYSATVPIKKGQKAIFVALQPKRFCFEEPSRRRFAYAPPLYAKIDFQGRCPKTLDFLQ